MKKGNRRMTFFHAHHMEIRKDAYIHQCSETGLMEVEVNPDYSGYTINFIPGEFSTTEFVELDFYPDSQEKKMFVYFRINWPDKQYPWEFQDAIILKNHKNITINP
jgi:hypothetical protein